mgnify:CR=1 FL=1
MFNCSGSDMNNLCWRSKCSYMFKILFAMIQFSLETWPSQRLLYIITTKSQFFAFVTFLTYNLRIIGQNKNLFNYTIYLTIYTISDLFQRNIDGVTLRQFAMTKTRIY